MRTHTHPRGTFQEWAGRRPVPTLYLKHNTTTTATMARSEHAKQTARMIRELNATVPVEHITRIISVEPKDVDFVHYTDSMVHVTYEVLGRDNKLYERTKWTSDASDSPLWKWWAEWRRAEDENGKSYWKQYTMSSMHRFLVPREEL